MRFSLFGLGVLASTLALGCGDSGSSSNGGGASTGSNSGGAGSSSGGSSSTATHSGTGTDATSGTVTFANGTGSASGGAGGSTMNCDPVLHAIVRDRSPESPDSNPDFENPNQGDDTSIVTIDLGPDGTPTYGGNPTTATTNGATYFHEWYHDLDSGTNYDFPIDLPLTKAGNVYTFDNEAYFPIDGKGYGDYQTSGHNFHFTTEIHTTVAYMGGEQLTFTGDDDFFAYVDKKLAVNLGGIHSAETRTIALDDLGLVKGKTYPLDLFGAERHTSESHFRIDTTIACFNTIPQ